MYQPPKLQGRRSEVMTVPADIPLSHKLSKKMVVVHSYSDNLENGIGD